MKRVMFWVVAVQMALGSPSFAVSRSTSHAGIAAVKDPVHPPGLDQGSENLRRLLQLLRDEIGVESSREIISDLWEEIGTAKNAIALDYLKNKVTKRLAAMKTLSEQIEGFFGQAPFDMNHERKLLKDLRRSHLIAQLMAQMVQSIAENGVPKPEVTQTLNKLVEHAGEVAASVENHEASMKARGVNGAIIRQLRSLSDHEEELKSLTKLWNETSARIDAKRELLKAK